MKDANVTRAETSSCFAERLKELWTDRRYRIILIRHLIPVVFLLFTLILSLLPVVSFQTADGRSDSHSLLYWHNANFFGTEDARGAYELLKLFGEGNQYYSFYRTVVTLYIVDAALVAVGTLLVILITAVSVYLLCTEEKTERSRFVGKLYRVAVGGRWTVLLPCLFTVIPFLFPRLFSHASTALRGYASYARFSLVDPLFILLIALLLVSVLFFRTRRREVGSRYDLYLAPEKREGRREIEEEREAREWEAAVRADADEPRSYREDPPEGQE